MQEKSQMPRSQDPIENVIPCLGPWNLTQGHGDRNTLPQIHMAPKQNQVSYFGETPLLGSMLIDMAASRLSSLWVCVCVYVCVFIVA